jgi:hypothetical protein
MEKGRRKMGEGGIKCVGGEDTWNNGVRKYSLIVMEKDTMIEQLEKDTRIDTRKELV